MHTIQALLWFKKCDYKNVTLLWKLFVGEVFFESYLLCLLTPTRFPCRLPCRANTQ